VLGEGLELFAETVGGLSNGCVPREQWPELAVRTRTEFVDGCRELFDADGRLRVDLL
jgi:hypothetical protein